MFSKHLHTAAEFKSTRTGVKCLSVSVRLEWTAALFNMFALKQVVFDYDKFRIRHILSIIHV